MVDLLIVVILIVLAALAITALIRDHREWNLGRCRKHGREWLYVNKDSAGMRGFKCSGLSDDVCSIWLRKV